MLPEAEPGKWVLVASPDGADGSVTINADTKLWAARLEAGQSLDYELPHGHAAWLQVTRGRLTLNDEALETSDGAAVEEVGALSIKAETEVEFLLFDLD